MRRDLLDIDLGQLHQRFGGKWAKYGPDVLPAWVADMDFPLAPVIRDRLVSAITTGDVGYPPADLSGLSDAVRNARAAQRWGWTVDPERIRYMPDVVKSIEVLFDVFTSPGDGVVVNTPIYPPFLTRTKLADRVVVENPLAADGGLDVDHFADTVTRLRPKVWLLCNPHNPTGRVLRADELQACASIAVDHDMLIISDEIHAELIYPDSPRHTPIATLGDDIAARTISLTSTSKPFNLAGLRSALIVFHNDALDTSFAEHQARAKDPVGSLGLLASMAAWTPEGDAWLTELVEVLDANRRTIADWAATHGVGHRSPEATYLAWLDFRPVGLGDDPSKWLLEHAKVALSIGGDFGELGLGHSRLNFATSPSILSQILDRLGSALQRQHP